MGGDLDPDDPVLATMTDRPAARREALRRELAAAELPGLLVWSEANVGYLSGFAGDSSALIVTADRTILVTDFRYVEQAGHECPGIELAVRETETPLAKATGATAAKLGCGGLGFEAAALSVAEFEALREASGSLAWTGRTGLVEGLRAVKDDVEVAAIRRAIDQAERAFCRLREELRPGSNEKELADTLDRYLREAGAAGASFPPIVGVGANSALPHGRPDPTSRVADADFLLIDWGATGGAESPYKSDLTRMIVTGKVASKFEDVYRVVLAAHDRAIAAIRPGVTAESVDAEARAVIEGAGFGPFFGHGLGHGVGRQIHEAPWLRRHGDEELRAGMVVTVEPGVYLPGWGGIRVEDDVLVTPDGAEVLSRLPRSLESVRGLDDE